MFMFLGIFLTLLTGLFFLIGIIFLKNHRHKEKISCFTIGLAFIVMLSLLLLDLLPEIIDIHNILLAIPILIGFFIFIILDKLIPHHHHEHTDSDCDKNDHDLHLNHIGIITIIALTIHNMLEGFTLYSITINNNISGLLMMISISLHNIPLGFQIGNSLKNKKNGNLLIFFLCISSLLGALIMIIFGSLSSNIINILLSLTFGMLLYILIFELFNEIKSNLKQKETMYGIIVGVIILVITYLLK